MNIPRYWAKAIAQETDRRGKQVQFTCWRGSNRSLEEAREMAAQGARNVINRLLHGEKIGRYDYAATPLREEILHEINETDGQPLALVTRNAYGAVVLNTSRVMFVDVDFPEWLSGNLFSVLFSLLLRRAGPPSEEKEQTKIIERVQSFLSEKPEFGFRIYRTCWGMRLLATNDLFDPTDSTTTQLLKSLGADPLYIKLCRGQGSFRARLTPKPWRCGGTVNPFRYPREDAEQEKSFEQWRSDYETRSDRYATCRYLSTLGNNVVHPAAEKIIELHDHLTRAHENLALA